MSLSLNQARVNLPAAGGGGGGGTIGGSGTLNYLAKFTPDGTTIGDSQVFDNGTYVGINNAAPDTKLDIAVNNLADNGAVLKLHNIGNGAVGNYTETGIIFFSSLANTNSDYLTGRVYATWDSSVAGDSRITIQGINAASNYVDTLTVKNNRVGINVTTPTASLHVKGEAATLATYTAKFQNSADVLSLQIRDDGSVYNLGPGGETESCYFGFSSGINDTAGVNNTGFGSATLSQTVAQQENTAFGYAVLAGVPGSQNCGFGSSTMQAATGEKNSAFGFNNMPNVSGNYNSSFGYASLGVLAGGVQNSAYGSISLVALSSGSYNTAVGFWALGNLYSSDRCVAIGYEAGLYETASNALYIHNGLGVSNLATGKSNSLIYGTFNATAALQTLKINGALIGGSAALATTATDGFWYVPSCAGVPTGVPTAFTGTIPMIADSTNNKLYIYSGGNWVALN